MLEIINEIREILKSETSSIREELNTIRIEELSRFIGTKSVEILSLLSGAGNLFFELKENHPEDESEWRFYLHGLQSIILRKIWEKAQPGLFTNHINKNTNGSND
jgi:hypothetical protein